MASLNDLSEQNGHILTQNRYNKWVYTVKKETAFYELELTLSSWPGLGKYPCEGDALIWCIRKNKKMDIFWPKKAILNELPLFKNHFVNLVLLSPVLGKYLCKRYALSSFTRKYCGGGKIEENERFITQNSHFRWATTYFVDSFTTWAHSIIMTCPWEVPMSKGCADFIHP